MAPCNGTTSTAPSNRTMSTPSKLVVTRLAHYNGTLQWHHPLPPPQHTLSNGTTSAPPKLVVALPSPHHSTLQWHPAMAPSNGTTSATPKLVVTLPLNHSTLQWHPTMAPSNGTTSTAPCNGTLVPRPIRQSGSSPPPPIGSKNPYSYRYLGNNIV